MRIRKAIERAILASACVLASSVRAQDPLTRPVPLAPVSSAVSAAEVAEWLQAAQRAHDFGQLTTAAGLYRRILDLASAAETQRLPEIDRTGVALALASVLIDLGDAAEAEQVLATIPPPHGAAWHLRTGLAALQLRKRELAQSSWDTIKPEELTPADRSWHTFLQAALYDLASPRDVTKANDLYRSAENSAANELARARFQLAGERVRLRLEPPTNEQLEATRRNALENQGRFVGFQFAYDYAVMLARAERRGDAVVFLQQQLLPPGLDRAWRDDFNFLLGLIGDRSRTGAGRNALQQLLASGSKPERQRQALDLLAAASKTEPERGLFRAELNRLIAVTPPHPIREALLYFRAQLALADRQFAQAESDANLLAREFPGSPLRAHAFGILTQSAWEQGRYRLAADHAGRAREALPAGTAGRARAELGVLEAEARFRAGLQAERIDRSATAGRVDFRQAADAYAAVVRERPAELKPAELADVMFLRVVAEIKSASPEAAQVLDQIAADPVFDLQHRWQAEWNLAQAWKLQARTNEAFARVAKLLADTGAAAAQLPADLRARMAWLQTRLAFDAQQFDTVLNLADRLLATLEGIDPALRAEIASTTILLKARAELALGREPAAADTLKQLRETHAKSEAAIHSYLIEAAHYEAQGKISQAQVQLAKLVDDENFKGSPYVPYALFELARLSELLGSEENLVAAYKRLEDLIAITKAPEQDELIFAARFKQADLLRRRNDFAKAQEIYEYLINNFARRPDVVFAHLALAECHNARSSRDSPQQQKLGELGHAEIARLKFEEVRDRADAPTDVRVEAGYNVGKLLERAGKIEEAALTWWRDVIDPFLNRRKTPIEHDAKRPYWLARTLLELGELRERQGRLEEAKDAYLTLARARLGHAENVAKRHLERLGVPTATL